MGNITPVHHFPEISILSPVYKNRETLEELHQRVTSSLAPFNRSYEIILINDACPEGSIDEIIRLSSLDERVFGLDLPSNRGQQKAYLAGFTIARGELIVTLDADLQDPPESLPELIAEIDKGYDVVFAGRKGRYEARSRLFFSKIYKHIMHWLTGLPVDAGLYLVMRRQLMEKLVEINAEGVHLVAVIGCLELNPSSIPVTRSIRPKGNSAFNFGMRLEMASRAIAWVVAYQLGKRQGSGPRPTVLSEDIKIIHKGKQIHGTAI